MRFLFLALLVSCISYGQTTYQFDEVLEYDFVSICKGKKWKWMQFHNTKDNSYQASVHIQENKELWFNFTFHKTIEHANFQIDNYVLADGYHIPIKKKNMHGRVVSHRIYPAKKENKMRYYYLKELHSQDPAIVRFEITPKKDKTKKREKLST